MPRKSETTSDTRDQWYQGLTTLCTKIQIITQPLDDQPPKSSCSSGVYRLIWPQNQQADLVEVSCAAIAKVFLPLFKTPCANKQLLYLRSWKGQHPIVLLQRHGLDDKACELDDDELKQIYKHVMRCNHQSLQSSKHVANMMDRRIRAAKRLDRKSQQQFSDRIRATQLRRDRLTDIPGDLAEAERGALELELFALQHPSVHSRYGYPFGTPIRSWESVEGIEHLRQRLEEQQQCRDSLQESVNGLLKYCNATTRYAALNKTK